MGLEVGWYLRFAKADRVEAKLSPTGIESVKHAMHMHNDWELETETKDGYVMARITRKKPLFDKKDT